MPEFCATSNPADPFTALIRAAVRAELEPLLAALDERQAEPEYRGRQLEAERLDISLSKLDRLCNQGLPFVMIGDARKFRAAEVDAWLSQRNKGGAT